tara:strand:+ start:241 stop:1008 length:768 start_codon:yes stop_codon:yes gene_type:complete
MPDYSNYQRAIKTQLTLNPEEWNFKNNKEFGYVLEHCQGFHAVQYFNAIKRKFKTFYESNVHTLKNICTLNDTYGKTKKYQLKNFMTCSPSNLRYILHSLLILEDMKKYKLNNIDIIEIGGGYGGLCFFIHNIAPLYEININSYTIFDLLEPSLLQKKYLNALNIEKVNCFTIDNFNNLKNNSFLISNYAFSEIGGKKQSEYIEKIINPYTTFGFLTWNRQCYDFVKNSIIEKEEEDPQTGSRNLYVRFYPTSNL